MWHHRDRHHPQDEENKMTTRPIRLMLVDDHGVVREGLEAVVARQSDMEVVASVGSGEEALPALPSVLPDVVLLDMRMPDKDGLETLQEIKAAAPRVKVLVLSGHAGDELIFRAINAGAAGYLLKRSHSSEIVNAVRHAMLGRVPPSPEVAQALAERVYGEALSEREVEVVRLAAEGAANKEIGDQLGITENTVKNHFKSIMSKLSASDRTEAVTKALRRGIISLDGNT